MASVGELPADLQRYLEISTAAPERPAEVRLGGQWSDSYLGLVRRSENRLKEQKRLGPEARRIVWDEATKTKWNNDVFDPWIKEIETSIDRANRELVNTAQLASREYRSMARKLSNESLADFKITMDRGARAQAETIKEMVDFVTFLRAVQAKLAPDTGVVGTFDDPATLRAHFEHLL